MKKVLIILFLNTILCNSSFAESYYFKECKLSEHAFGDYLIDFDKNVIKVTLKTKDRISQELTDKIKLITKDQIVSDIIQNKTNKKYYLQYNLDVASKSIIRQRFIKKNKDAFIMPDGPKKKSDCLNVKANWIASKPLYLRNALRAKNTENKAYLTVDANIIYRFEPFKIGFKVKNLFDENYYHSGAEAAASGDDFEKRSQGWANSLIPQTKRNFMLTVSITF